MPRGMYLELEVFGDSILSRRLFRFGERAIDAAPAWAAIIEKIQEDLKTLFATEGASGGEPWAPLADSTLERKAELGLSSKILNAEGFLEDSLTKDDALGSVKEIDPQGFRFGSDLAVESGDYILAELHQKGTEFMDARPPLQFTELQKRGYVKQLQEYLVEGLK